MLPRITMQFCREGRTLLSSSTSFQTYQLAPQIGVCFGGKNSNSISTSNIDSISNSISMIVIVLEIVLVIVIASEVAYCPNATIMYHMLVDSGNIGPHRG